MKRHGDCLLSPWSCLTLAGVNTVLALAAGSNWAQAPAGPQGYPYGGHMMWGGAWYGMILGPLFMILVLVAVLAGIALIARWFGLTRYETPPAHHARPGRAPLDILKERFARGEIDKEEFEERRRVLSE